MYIYLLHIKRCSTDIFVTYQKMFYRYICYASKGVLQTYLFNKELSRPSFLYLHLCQFPEKYDPINCEEFIFTLLSNLFFKGIFLSVLVTCAEHLF